MDGRRRHVDHTNSDLLVTTAMRYGLDLQPSAVPRQSARVAIKARLRRRLRLRRKKIRRVRRCNEFGRGTPCPVRRARGGGRLRTTSSATSSLALTRGQASLVLGAVAAGRNYGKGATGRKASAEWSSTDCQPCVDLSWRLAQDPSTRYPQSIFDSRLAITIVSFVTNEVST